MHPTWHNESRALTARSPGYFAALALIWLLGVAATGCPGKPQRGTQSASQHSRQMSGLEIWNGSQSAYAQAKSYRDRAVLYLSYRLQGQLIQEPQPWSVSWTREPTFAANLFNAQLRYDGKKLGCFVYDNSTANLDNQWLLIEQRQSIPIESLLNDSLARYFVGGFSEIPLNENPHETWRGMLPPTIGWLSKETSSSAWVQPDRAERLNDSLVDNRPCFHLRLHTPEFEMEVWIDQETRLVRQMTLPFQLLDPAIRTAVELSEIQFFARFHEAEFNAPIPAEAVAVVAPEKAIPVRQFVALPEAFPSAQIGSPMPAMRLTRLDGSAVDIDPDGNPIVLVWTSGLVGQLALAELLQLKAELDEKPIRWWGVFSDDQAAMGSSRPKQLLPEIQDWIGRQSVSLDWLYDSQLQSAQDLKLESLPAAVVISPDGRIQYVVSLSADRWSERLRGALLRVQRGESIADEMRADYEAYLERYQKRLQLVDARQALQSTTADPDAATESQAVTGTLRWQATGVQRPGNLYVDSAGAEPRILALDGWQTVVEFDLAGQAIASHRLDLPDGAAVTCLRPGNQPADRLCAAFAPFGHAIYLFDQDWKLTTRIQPEREFESDQVVDCQWIELESNPARLLVAWQRGGLQMVDVRSLATTRVDQRVFDAVAGWGSTLLGICDSQLCFRPEAGDWQPLAIPGFRPVRLYVPRRNQSPLAYVAGIRDSGAWGVVALNRDGVAETTAALGPQLFDSALEPCQSSNRTAGLTAWADSSQRIHFFQSGLRPLGFWQSSQPFAGFALCETNDQVLLLISRNARIEAYHLSWPQEAR